VWTGIQGRGTPKGTCLNWAVVVENWDVKTTTLRGPGRIFQNECYTTKVEIAAGRKTQDVDLQLLYRGNDYAAGEAYFFISAANAETTG
jgi:hypothetical protein